MLARFVILAGIGAVIGAVVLALILEASGVSKAFSLSVATISWTFLTFLLLMLGGRHRLATCLLPVLKLPIRSKSVYLPLMNLPPLLLLEFGAILSFVALLAKFSPSLALSFLSHIANPVFKSGSSFQTNLIIFFGVVLIAPFGEELLFRGLLFRRWQAKWGGVVAALLSATLFAVLHPAILPQFLFALVATALLVKTGSLWPGIFLHAGNNLFIWVLSVFGGSKAPTGADLADLARYGWIYFVMFAVGSIWAVWFFRRYWPLLKSDEPLLQFQNENIPGMEPSPT